MSLRRVLFLAPLLLGAAAAPPPLATSLDRAATRWVERTLRAMTPGQRIAQLVVPGLNGVFTSVDGDAHERLARFARQRGVGGFHVFGGQEPMPAALLNPGYGTGGTRARKADALATAALLNRLQREARVPLLVTADFEGGAGYIVEGATRFPRSMAFGAAGETALLARAGEITAREGRALGIHVNFSPVVDVNNNPRNPIINVRSFGEDPVFVGEMASALIHGLQRGGMLATAKHFPGHGDTAVDTHLDVAVIEHARERLDAVELVPFRAAIAGGVDAVMSSHIRLPALDPTPERPATLSRPILTRLLREELRFDGLVFTDSMSMHAISRGFPPGEAAAMAVGAGADLILDPPDPDAAIEGLRDAVDSGALTIERVDRSVRRILRAKARLGLHRVREMDLMAVPAVVGGRAHQAVADEAASRAITLLKDDRGDVPLALPRSARLLYLSVVDYASGWREGAPSRTLLPELRRRFDDVVAVEVTDRTSAAEMDLVREVARRSEATVASIFVRIASYSGRMDLTPAQTALLEELGREESRPFVAIVFGNPYVASLAVRLPAVLLTYEYADVAEAAALRALFGEAAIGGTLPITLPGLYAAGHGLRREPSPPLPAQARP